MGMFDLAWELEDELSDFIEKFGGILKVIRDLTDLSPPWLITRMRTWLDKLD